MMSDIGKEASMILCSNSSAWPDFSFSDAPIPLKLYIEMIQTVAEKVETSDLCGKMANYLTHLKIIIRCGKWNYLSKSDIKIMLGPSAVYYLTWLKQLVVVMIQETEGFFFFLIF